MRLPDVRRPVVLIVGPTAVGKTEISLQLAERLGGEIVSADSRLFYRGMDIGTAKPSVEEQQRVPHHLVDVADPDQILSLAHFQQVVGEVISSIHARGKLPFLVGGTGQYVRAVIEGWSPAEQESDPQLRAVLEAWGAESGARALHERLAVIDREAADRIQFQNMRRTIRALEVIFRTGRRFSEQQRQRSETPYSLLIVGLKRPRPELYARIDARIDQMLEQGFEAEVQALLAKGYSPDLPTMSAIGYREMIAHLRGEMTLDEVVVQMKRLTRQFVRRQANWFKETDPNTYWFNVGPDTVAEVETFICSGDGWIRPGDEK